MIIDKTIWKTKNPACSFTVIVLTVSSGVAITDEMVYWLVDKNGDHFTIDRALAFAFIAKYDMHKVAHEIIEEQTIND